MSSPAAYNVRTAKIKPGYVPQFSVLIAAVPLYVVLRTSTLLFVALAYFVSCLVPSTFRINDDALSRRLMWSKWMELDAHPSIRAAASSDDEIDVREEYVTNSRGMCLLTSTSVPRRVPVRGVVCYCHGYSSTPTGAHRAEWRRLVRSGYALLIIEYEGHGRSDGLLCLIPSFDRLLGDVLEHFGKLADGREELRGKPRFLAGESLGGAVAISLYMREKASWAGVILLAPMCEISKKPPQLVIDLLSRIAGPPGTSNFLSRLPITPSSNIAGRTFKLDHKREMAVRNPCVYDRKARLATGRELLDATGNVSGMLHEFDAPVLILHGAADAVTCPKMSQRLHDGSPSKDKTIRIFEGMWHSLTIGEPDENVDLVFGTIVGWLNERTQ